MQKSRSLTPEEVEMLRGPDVMSQFPVIFANGNRFTQFRAICKQCGEGGASEHTYGRVVRPYPNVAIVRGVLWCESCNFNTPFEWRLHDDLRMSGLRNGRWVEGRLRGSGIIGRILRWLFPGIVR